ncbi:hypothetical protein V1J52_19205 [Streptomyces sp. TRM 70351]|uniref:hypothetical protein n=1 Tax=Streptomyces sp. TRM 70351 TaxID=3116552 RepID=UPI002E7B4C9A|nr:hypothetical protein [Streptomyces sp. TRM 70351]MEE1930284.1 hypothetical protein [Streptomyces sp. TRM 70351]
MESAPAAFAGAVCGLFGAALLLWTAARARHGRPVVAGPLPVTQPAAALLALLVSLAFLGTGVWLLANL